MKIMVGYVLNIEIYINVIPVYIILLHQMKIILKLIFVKVKVLMIFNFLKIFIKMILKN